MTSAFAKLTSVLLTVAGLLDAAYLTYEHYSNRIIPCTNSWIIDCGKVLKSEYATVGPVPVAVLGVFFYGFLLGLLLLSFKYKKCTPFLFLSSAIGLFSSIYFMYLQVAVIGAICLYCSISALICLCNFIAIRLAFREFYRRHILILGSVFYQVIKKFLFRFDPEFVHNRMTGFGELLGKSPLLKKGMRFIFKKDFPSLNQSIAGISFKTPVGLSAGFDYEAKLTQTLEPIGFGFQTVGTITNSPCEGNPKPRLGRLPKSRALLVNKGFRNPGADAVIKKLTKMKFSIPVGISIGRTNNPEIDTVEKAIADIITSFIKWEKSSVRHSYYELNISCPNLMGNITFYDPEVLSLLLKRVFAGKLKKPLFIKMPIELSDKDFLKLLFVISHFPVAGIIIGNLQKKRNISELDKEEVKNCGKGNFSGKPTEKRSNELIHLAYKHLDKKFTIIGCGGVFNAEDAFEKICHGASLIQLITGMIYQGPQLIAQINADLEDIIKNEGFDHISEAVGSAHG